MLISTHGAAAREFQSYIALTDLEEAPVCNVTAHICEASGTTLSRTLESEQL
jgi:hypothetical protein